MTITRRAALAGLAVAGAVLPGCAAAPPAPASQAPHPAPPQQIDFQAEIAALEARAGGKLGVCLYDVFDALLIGHHRDEAFGMCSTFKLPLAGIILREADAGRLDLAQRLPFGPADMVPYAPVAEANVARGYLTVEEAARAAQITSDNVAANLLIDLLGGPEAVTAHLHSEAFGAHATRIDRREPEVNLVVPGDKRDTTTPRDMARLAAWLTIVQPILRPESQAKLIDWMVATATGQTRIRAGLPADWRAGDKTGTGLHPSMPNRYNDVAVIWPPGRSPLALAVYYEGPVRTDSQRPEDNAVLAEVGRLAAAWSLSNS